MRWWDEREAPNLVLVKMRDMLASTLEVVFVGAVLDENPQLVAPGSAYECAPLVWSALVRRRGEVPQKRVATRNAWNPDNVATMLVNQAHVDFGIGGTFDFEGIVDCTPDVPARVPVEAWVVDEAHAEKIKRWLLTHRYIAKLETGYSWWRIELGEARVSLKISMSATDSSGWGISVEWKIAPLANLKTTRQHFGYIEDDIEVMRSCTEALQGVIKRIRHWPEGV